MTISSHPKEFIHIEGARFAFPTMNKISVINRSKNERGKLFFLMGSDIPQSEILNEINEAHSDSLVDEISFFEADSSRYYVLGWIDMNEKDTVHYKMDHPIIHPDNYVFAVPSVPSLDITVGFEFQRVGDNEKPKIKKIRI